MDKYKYKIDNEALNYCYDEILCNYDEEDKDEVFDNYD